jgi:hypothetical protein
MNYKGSCHCGGIRFEVEGDFREVMECNCSICSRKGSLLGFAPQEKLKMLTPKEQMGTYTFNKHIIKHHFCPTCGIHPLAEAKDRSGKPTAAINVRCLEGIDLDSLKVKQFDGRSL